jgi:hypothetical protein
VKKILCLLLVASIGCATNKITVQNHVASYIYYKDTFTQLCTDPAVAKVSSPLWISPFTEVPKLGVPVLDILTMALQILSSPGGLSVLDTLFTDHGLTPILLAGTIQNLEDPLAVSLNPAPSVCSDTWFSLIQYKHMLQLAGRVYQIGQLPSAETKDLDAQQSAIKKALGK